MKQYQDESRQGVLFSDEQNHKVDGGPVTCLGITFANDDERREHFRKELRKKLPELRQLEGFPNGEDEDIIALSDPPYYTACPNPWLNDFVAQWESEKISLEETGLRDPNFEVKEPYASDVSEGKANPIYMAHAYHTKVPHPAIMRYILHYTEPGDIILDGFSGTGMTGVASNICADRMEVSKLNIASSTPGSRHCICTDLSPIASLISASYNLDFDVESFKSKAINILNKVDTELGWMFETKHNGSSLPLSYTVWSDVFICPSCGADIVLWDEAVNLSKNVINGKFRCPVCGGDCDKSKMERVMESSYDPLLQDTVTLIKKVPVLNTFRYGSRRIDAPISAEDLSKLNSIIIGGDNQHTLSIPKGDEVSRNEKYGITYFHQFYTNRSFIYLSRVNELVKGDLHLQAWFTSVLLNLSKMYKFRIDRKGSMLYGTFYLPSLSVEFNPYIALKNKISDFASSYYMGRGNSVVGINSATNISQLADNSIDYIFTDPPFGANLMYSELSSIWEGWLNITTNNQQEAVVSKTQDKSLMAYQSLMTKSLKEYYRVLKPGKWLTMEFSNTAAAVWNSLQTALTGAGFVVVNVASLDKKQGTFKAITTPTAVKQDLIITCYKPSEELSEKFSSKDAALNIWDFVEELLLHLPIHLGKGCKTTAVVERSPKILFDRTIAYYVQHNYPVPLNAAEFQKGLKEHFIERDGMFFTADQVIEYEEKKSATSSFEPMALFVGSESEGIQWLKRELEKPQTYQEIHPNWMQSLVATKKGDTLPELMTILKENFIEDENGCWRNPDAEKEADLEKLRARRLAHEFKAYVEAASKPKVKIKDARLEALRHGFKECYKSKDFKTILAVAARIPESLLMEDEQLLQYYDIASNFA